jgi:hypothetical protein
MLLLSKVPTQKTQGQFFDGMRVADVSNPDRRGKIIKAGSEVSEVRFDDDIERNIPNNFLRAIEGPVDDELARPTDLTEAPDHAVRQGQAAWHRLRLNSTWDDWKKVGTAHVVGRAAAMRDGHINKPKGRSYNAAFAAWQKKYGFEGLDKGDRARLFDIMDHLAEIEAWLAKLKPADRLRLNHPSSIWRRWKAAKAADEPDKAPRVSPIQKYKDSIIRLEEENARMKREIAHGGGDLWTPEDRPRDIAQIMISKLNKSKAEKVAREILKLSKEVSNA